MGFSSDVKSTRLAASGAIFGGRSRIKGIYIVPSSNAGSVVLRDGGAAGTVVATIDTVANGTTVYLHIAEDGLLCTTSSYATLTNVTAITAFYA